MIKFAYFLYLIAALSIVKTYAADEAASDKDKLGGWKKIASEATAFFYVKEIDGVWWIVNPAGNAFLSKGVNHISFFADNAPQLGYSPYGRATQKKYGTEGAWAKAAMENLWRWNFNTAGAWCSSSMYKQEFPYTPVLDVASHAGANWQKGIFPDVFSKKFRTAARSAIQAACRPQRDNKYLLGYFTDNELRWGPDWRSPDALLMDFLRFDHESEGWNRAIQFLKERYSTVDALNEQWKIKAKSFEELSAIESFPPSDARAEAEEMFVKIVAGEYFRVCAEEIRDADPHHMILGCRFAGKASETVLEAMAPYADIVSFNTYNFTPPAETLKRIYEITKRPIMITEFSFKAMDSGLPNTRGAGKPLATQKERAEHFTEFITQLLQLPFVVGYHWFEYADEPAEGRFDGENSNYGLVNIKDEPWEILTTEMTQTNFKAEKIHAGLEGGKANVDEANR